MARGDVRIAVTLACEDCKRRNYQTNKSRRNSPDRVELRKFCRWCGHHTRTRRRASPMAKTRAQRKAERRAREAEERKRGGDDERSAEARAQHDTQVPVSGDVAEIEAVEAGIAAGAAESDLETPDAPKTTPAPSVAPRRRSAKEAEKRATRGPQAPRERAARQAPEAGRGERQRGGVIGFLASCWAELKKVQWPDRDTLVQATAVTIIFVAVAAAYLGALDGVFNFLIKRIL